MLKVKVLGVFAMIDEGETDCKVMAIDDNNDDNNDNSVIITIIMIKIMIDEGDTDWKVMTKTIQNLKR